MFGDLYCSAKGVTIVGVRTKSCAELFGGADPRMACWLERTGAVLQQCIDVDGIGG